MCGGLVLISEIYAVPVRSISVQLRSLAPSFARVCLRELNARPGIILQTVVRFAQNLRSAADGCKERELS